MDKLIPIIRTFDKYKISRIDVLNNPESKSRQTKLYRLIKKGKINSDDDAARLLFGKDATKQDAKYRTFKSDFKKRLFNTLLFIDTEHEDFDDYNKIVYEANKEWIVIRSLERYGMLDIATPLAETLLAMVIKYEYTQLAVQILETVKYGVAMQGDKKAYEEYNELSNYQTILWLNEQKAKHYHNLLRLEYVNNKAYKPHIAATAKSYFEELEPLMEKDKSTAFHIQARTVELYLYSATNNYERLLEASESAVTFFRSKHFELRGAIHFFLQQKMAALLMLRRYTEAESAINESLKLRIKGSFNWFVAQSSRVVVYFKMRRYTEGYAIYKEVTAMPELNYTMLDAGREIWHLFDAYFHLLFFLGLAPDLPLGKGNQAFKFSKFLNNVPIFSNDKKGMNLALVILEICFMITLKQHDALIDRVEAFQKYFTRNTQKDDPSYRFHQFGNMLLEIPKAGFNRAILERNTAGLLKDLESVPYAFEDANYWNEIIELEELWAMMLENFDKVK
jgi:hypothetical protein